MNDVKDLALIIRSRFPIVVVETPEENRVMGLLEQAIVSALYEAHASQRPLATEHILAEVKRTRPLSIVMAEKIQALWQWAAERTVPAG